MTPMLKSEWTMAISSEARLVFELGAMQKDTGTVSFNKKHRKRDEQGQAEIERRIRCRCWGKKKININ